MFGIWGNKMHFKKIIKFTLLTLIFQLFTVPITHAADTGITRHRYTAINNYNKTDQLGVGLKVGGLAGVTFEYWNTAETTLNLSLISDRYSWGVSASHNWMLNRINTESSPLNYSVSPYVGAGLLLGFGRYWIYKERYNEPTFLALQVPLGVEFLPGPERFSLFGEVTPSIDLTSKAVGFISADIGARYYF